MLPILPDRLVKIVSSDNTGAVIIEKKKKKKKKKMMMMMMMMIMMIVYLPFNNSHNTNDSNYISITAHNCDK